MVKSPIRCAYCLGNIWTKTYNTYRYDGEKIGGIPNHLYFSPKPGCNRVCKQCYQHNYDLHKVCVTISQNNKHYFLFVHIIKSL